MSAKRKTQRPSAAPASETRLKAAMAPEVTIALVDAETILACTEIDHHVVPLFAAIEELTNAANAYCREYKREADQSVRYDAIEEHRNEALLRLRLLVEEMAYVRRELGDRVSSARSLAAEATR